MTPEQEASKLLFGDPDWHVKYWVPSEQSLLHPNSGTSTTFATEVSRITRERNAK